MFGGSPVREALLFSDVHLGWALCGRHHARWLARLPEAVGDAELVVLNGDVIDGHRGARVTELVERLAAMVTAWRCEGRTVVYLEGNHDPAARGTDPLRPDGWHYDFRTTTGERVRVLHGHRLSPSEVVWGAYDRAGRRVLALENRAYARVRALRRAYRFGPGWIVSGVAALECTLARRQLSRRAGHLVRDVDVLAHGHVHYGPGQGRIGHAATYRTGSWVSPGHLGSADRMLRYRHGRFERIALADGCWRAPDDGR